MNKDRRVVVRQEPDAPVAKEVLASAIVKISEAMTALRRSGLNRRAIVILASASSGEPQYRVIAVLDALDALKKDYCS